MLRGNFARSRGFALSLVASGFGNAWFSAKNRFAAIISETHPQKTC
jgi:hypothetical protein